MTVYIYIFEQLCYMLMLINLPCLTSVLICLFLITKSHSCFSQYRYVQLTRNKRAHIFNLYILHQLTPLIRASVRCMYNRHNYQSWLLNFLNLLRNLGLSCQQRIENLFFSEFVDEFPELFPKYPLLFSDVLLFTLTFRPTFFPTLIFIFYIIFHFFKFRWQAHHPYICKTYICFTVHICIATFQFYNFVKINVVFFCDCLHVCF